MKRMLKWLGILLGSLIVLLLLAYGYVYFSSNARITKTYDVTPAPVAVPDADSLVLARGEHVATIRGCRDCHSADLEGKVFIDDPALGTLLASNLTRGAGGVGQYYTDVDWVRATRHGIAPDGRPLLYMPSHEFYYIGNEDLGALIAYIKQVPPVDHELPASTVGPLGRVLFLTGALPLVPAELIAHDVPPPAAPPPGVTVEYGRYLAVTCKGCHGDGFSGGPVPGAPPDWPPVPNLTFDEETGLAAWSEEDFFTLLRTGKRPDGREINPAYMPWAPLSQMTDDEIRAIWIFLQSLPHKTEGNR
ncbi:MAG: c-type cytochrome [Rhodothermales bacterium]